MYAVIETGGKQYRVELGSEIAVERLDGDPGETLEIERVLLVADDDDAAIGRPLVEGAHVSASIVRQDRSDKVVVFKYKPKARRRVKHGHRQDQTVLRVADIVYGKKSALKLAEAALSERQRLESAAASAAEERATADRALAEKLKEQAEKAAEAAAEEAPTKPARRRARRAAAPPPEQEEQAEAAAPEAGSEAPVSEAPVPLEGSPEASAEAQTDVEPDAGPEAQSGETVEKPEPNARPRRTRSRKDE